MRKVKSIMTNILLFVICGLVAYLISFVLLGVTYIDGPSMEPTIHHEDKVLMSVYKPAKNLKHGDIVVFQSDVINKKLIKRVIGLPGDIIEIKAEAEGNFLYRNGNKVIEDYILEPMLYSNPAIMVPDDKFYFLGDNRNISLDSHLGAMDELDTIEGRVLMRFKTKGFDFEIIKRLFTSREEKLYVCD